METRLKVPKDLVVKVKSSRDKESLLCPVITKEIHMIKNQNHMTHFHFRKTT